MSKDLGKVFAQAYGANGVWAGYESGSGEGSSRDATSSIRGMLPNIVSLFGIQSILDIPCGDFHWMSKVDLGISYIGADIVQDVVTENKHKFPGVDFRHLDLTSSELPKVDLVFCRDCFGHLSYSDCHKALENIRASGSNYMMLTTFWNHLNLNKTSGPDWRARSMTRSPFNLPLPILVVDELCQEVYPKFSDKSMALWKL